MDSSTIQNIAVFALPVLFAITLHEAAHGYVAKHFGDNTAYVLGRVSLNPLKHIDPIGTIAMPLFLYFVTNGQFIFGYAKPVPVNFGRLKNPRWDSLWVALAGPASNFVMAFGWVMLSIILNGMHVQEPFFTEMARAGVLTNLVMCAFNLFPILPLDGGRILSALLPQRYAYSFSKIEPYGFFIVMALVVSNVIGTWWMLPIMRLLTNLLYLLLSPLSLIFR